MQNFDDIINNIKNTFIKKSQIHGFGLFAEYDFYKNSVLVKLDGQEISWQLYKKEALAYEWNAISKDTIVVRPYRTKYSYINHSKKPNLKVIFPYVFAICNIKKNDELLLDYTDEPLPIDYIEGVDYL